MKKVLITLLSVVIAPAVFAQGFFYNNFASEPGTGFVTFDGQPAPAGLFSIDIFWGTSSDSLVALGNPVPVGELDLGYFDGGTANIPVVGTPASVFIQYRVVTAGYFGSSAIVTQPLAYAPSTPADPVLPPTWNVVVPEPSTFALAGLAGAAMLITRRRK